MGCKFFIARMSTVGEHRVFRNFDIPHLDLGAFVDFERDFER